MRRNRSQGWVHAKHSGHQNEDLLSENVHSISSLKQIYPGREIDSVKVGGIREKNVPNIIGATTKSKTDMAITWSDNSQTKLSIKKSLGGQAYLIRTSRFIEGYEAHYGTTIDEVVKDGLLLFFGEHPAIGSILSQYPSENTGEQAYQIRKSRLTWHTLTKHDIRVANAMLDWIKENIGNIADFCFSRGLATSSNDWADYIWYKNMLGEHAIDQLFSIESMKEACTLRTDLVTMGTRGGGTTINLPFGFVQWHQGQMQFHHSYDDIRKLLL